MLITLLLGLAVVAVSAALLLPVIFSNSPDPATVAVGREGTPVPRPAPSVPTVTILVPESVSVHPAWWERLRGVAGLLLVIAGSAAAVSVVLGLAVFGASLFLVH